MKLRITPRASQDLDEVLDNIAQHRPLTVANVAARIRSKIELLGLQPLFGELVGELGPEFRR